MRSYTTQLRRGTERGMKGADGAQISIEEAGKRKNERVKSIVMKIMEVIVTNGMTVTIGTKMTVGTLIRIEKW